MLHPQPLFSLPQPGRFYALDEQGARQFDAEQPPGAKHFAAMLPGGNAYLLDYEAFDPNLYEDIDPGEAEPGCELEFGEALSQEQRLQLCSGLIALGYAVSLFNDRLLLVPWHRETITMAVVGDMYHIASAFPRENPQGSLFRLSEDMVLAWLDAADTSLALAQEFFAPFEQHALETEADSPRISQLRGAALRFQAARRFLEEGYGILEGSQDAVDE